MPSDEMTQKLEFELQHWISHTKSIKLSYLYNKPVFIYTMLAPEGKFLQVLEVSWYLHKESIL